MVRRLAELQGGSVSLQSVLGQGSTFTFWLPWRRNVDVAAPSAGTVLTVCDSELNPVTVGTSLDDLDERENTR
jgi:hypothetical protein